MSRRPEDVLAQYRAAQSLGDADRARLFEAVAERLAKGGAVDPKASGAHASVSGASAKVIALGAKIVLGLALAGASSAAWFATRGPVGHDAPVTQMAPPAAFATATPGADWHPIAAQVTVPAPEPTQARGAARTPEVAEVDSGSAGAPNGPPVAERAGRASARASQGTTRPAARAHPASSAPSDHAAAAAIADDGAVARPAPAPAIVTSAAVAASPASAPADPAGLGSGLFLPAASIASSAEGAPSPRSAPANPPAAAVSPASSGAVDEEVRLIGLAYASLRDGNPSKALAVLAEHERRFPSGKLAETRRVTRILALCDAGRTSEAEGERDRFLSLYPRSPFSSRVRAACAGGGPP